mmetsp:Transcript_20786/g.31677  ORF Transcript_20786/g.31677 Transcript_20786/m.31677 type:complete len:80 (-) Transcript_20786:9-248(-)
MIYISSNETTTTRRAFIASKSVPGHNFSVCDDGCFAFVDVGGSVQLLKCQQDHLSILVCSGRSESAKKTSFPSTHHNVK